MRLRERARVDAALTQCAPPMSWQAPAGFVEPCPSQKNHDTRTDTDFRRPGHVWVFGLRAPMIEMGRATRHRFSSDR